MADLVARRFADRFARGEVSLETARDGSQAAFVRPGTRQLFTIALDGSDLVGLRDAGRPDRLEPGPMRGRIRSLCEEHGSRFQVPAVTAAV